VFFIFTQGFSLALIYESINSIMLIGPFLVSGYMNGKVGAADVKIGVPLSALLQFPEQRLSFLKAFVVVSTFKLLWLLFHFGFWYYIANWNHSKNLASRKKEEHVPLASVLALSTMLALSI
jgi:hypothetical protein